MIITPRRLPWDTFADGELTDERAWWLRVFSWLNQLRDQANVYGVWKAREASSATTAVTNTWTAVSLDSLSVDTIGAGLTGGGFVAPTTGVYACVGSVGNNATTGNRVGAQVAKNSVASSIDGTMHLMKPPSVAESIISGFTFVSLTAGDRLDVMAYQESGASVALSIVATRMSTLSVMQVA